MNACSEIFADSFDPVPHPYKIKAIVNRDSEFLRIEFFIELSWNFFR
jgi:hypothetical protein